MKRIPSVFVVTAFLLSIGGLAFAQGSADSSATKETPAQEKAEEKAEATHHTMHHATTMKMHPLDLNTATKEELMKLSGVTDEIAEKIIAGRPYTSKAELVSKNVLTKAEYRKIRGKLMIKKSAAK